MVSSRTIRVSMETYARLHSLALDEQVSIGTVVERAVDLHEEKSFWQRYHQQFRQAETDPVVLAQWREEVAVFDGALLDGLDENP